MLRQEIYGDDGSPRAALPYTVTEHSFAVRCLARRGEGVHAVFMTVPRESIVHHYEREPSDPRTEHELTLGVDDFGNVLAAASVAYGRRAPDPSLPVQADRDAQARTIATYSEQIVTAAIDADADFRAPLAADARSYELTGFTPSGPSGRLVAADLVRSAAVPGGVALVYDRELPYEAAPTSGRERRLVGHTRTLYRRDDLTALCPLGTVESRAHTGERYQLAFTAGLVAQVYGERIADPAAVLGDAGYRADADLVAAGLFPAAPAPCWWKPSGRVYLSPDPTHAPADELAHAQAHFFLPARTADPFDRPAVSTARIITYDAHDLLPVAARDALGNTVRAANDYRVLQPARVTDANGNVTALAFDRRGLVVGTAVMGRDGEPAVGDSLAGFTADLDEATVLAHLAEPLADPLAILGRASTRIVYDVMAYVRTARTAAPLPAVSYVIARETHASEPGGAASAVQHGLSYTDGLGRVLQHKALADAGRWVVSGWTIVNAKGQPVRRYEPFFSATPAFEPGVIAGVSSVLFYDPPGRVVATLHPEHTFDKLVITAWAQRGWDANDTVLLDPRTDADVAALVAPYFAAQDPAWTTWHAQRAAGDLGAAEQAAAQRTAPHAATPAATFTDARGRTILALAHAGFAADGTATWLPTRTELDVAGRTVAVHDAVPSADPRGRLVIQCAYAVTGEPICTRSMDAGPRWQLLDALGMPVRAWDARGHAQRTEYDALRRPLRVFAAGIAAPELLVERRVYGEQHPDPAANLRGALYLHLDQAGAVTDEAHDFQGRSLRGRRRIALAYDHAIDWSAVESATAAAPLDLAALDAALAPLVAPEVYASRTTYDALGRAIQLIPPHADTPGAARHVVQPGYTPANQLARVDVWLGVTADPGALLDPAAVAPAPVGVAAIEYDARGRRLRIGYKNGAETRYAYDPLSSRLAQLYTRRGAAFTEDCTNPQPPPDTVAAPAVPPPGAACGLQNLTYTHDPVGNVVRIADGAQQAVYFRNRRVDASNDYTHDPLYRLVEATGREHLGQIGGAPAAYSYDDAPRIGLAHPNDGNALGRYVERYAYDPAGNLSSMQHIGVAPASPGWTRGFRYAEPGALEPGVASNRLTSAQVGTAQETYSSGGDGYDAHGNMLRMPQLAALQWDFRDQLQMTSRQAVDGADADGAAHQGERTWYVYDAAGRRVRKATVSAAGQLRSERRYLGGLELYVDHTGAGVTRETLHVMDDQRRIASVEDGVLVRYHLANHLGSATLDLDAEAQIIAYEEYTPHGSTAYQAVRSRTEAPRRYRYTGRERDDESGLYYHEARYFAPWLGRWTSCDPAGLVDGPNLYRYARNSPVGRSDPGGMESKPVEDKLVLPHDFTGQESADTVHQVARSQGYDFTGTPRWIPETRSWDVGTLTPIGSHRGTESASADSPRESPAAPTSMEPRRTIDDEVASTASRAAAGGLSVVEQSHWAMSPTAGGKALHRMFENMPGNNPGFDRRVGSSAIEELKTIRGNVKLSSITSAVRKGATQLTRKAAAIYDGFAKTVIVHMPSGTSPQRLRHAEAALAGTEVAKKVAVTARTGLPLTRLASRTLAKGLPFVGALASAYELSRDLERNDWINAVGSGTGLVSGLFAISAILVPVIIGTGIPLALPAAALFGAISLGWTLGTLIGRYGIAPLMERGG